MAVRYRAVNASVVINDADIKLNSGNKGFTVSFNKVFYTVPQGCTSKVNFIRTSSYRMRVQTVSTTGSTSNLELYRTMSLSLKTNGMTIKGIITPTGSNTKEIDVSGQFMYLNAGDQLCVIDEQTAVTPNDSWSINGTPTTIEQGYLYLSIIEEYQS